MTFRRAVAASSHARPVLARPARRLPRSAGVLWYGLRLAAAPLARLLASRSPQPTP